MHQLHEPPGGHQQVEYRLAATDVAAAKPAGQPRPAVAGHDVDVLATLLLGLAGGLVGGGAAMAGWTAATRRRLHRAAPAR